MVDVISRKFLQPAINTPIMGIDMSLNTCFVIMPIGNQLHNGVEITAIELKRRYDDLIREALLAANSRLEITRADEVALPGTITSDILTRIMRSDLVVADVSYPNPNVFYELGLRHACKSGTIIIRDSKAPKPPFDIAHLRHIEYENTPTGLKTASKILLIRSGNTLHILLSHPTDPTTSFKNWQN